MSWLLNTKTGEVCDERMQSGSDFVRNAGGWKNIARISYEAYSKIKRGEDAEKLIERLKNESLQLQKGR